MSEVPEFRSEATTVLSSLCDLSWIFSAIEALAEDAKMSKRTVGELVFRL